MALAGTLVADIYTGFTSTAWTAWLFFAVFIGIIVQWIFTVRFWNSLYLCFLPSDIAQVVYASLSPSFTVTDLYGINHFLFTSAYFWLCLPLTILLSLAPRFLFKAWKIGYNPNDLETLQYLQKKYPNQDLSRFSGFGNAPTLSALKRRTTVASRRSSFTSNVASLGRRFTRPSVDMRMSRTDMSTGIISVDRGFDFATEEDGVEMRRVQTNLSERRSNNPKLGSKSATWNKGKVSNVLSLPRNFLKRKHPSQDKGSE